MEIVKRKRNNSKKQPCFGNSFFKKRVVQNECDRFSFQISYPKIYSKKYFKSLKSC